MNTRKKKDDAPIGRVLQGHRKRLGLTQEQLSRKADVPYTTLTKIESGVIRNPSAEVVAKLGRALGVSLDALMGPKILLGDQSIRAIWDDVLATLTKPGEYMCITGVREDDYLETDRKGLKQFLETLAERGLNQRIISCQGDTQLIAAPHMEYRVIPKRHFGATPTYVYGNKVAVLIWGPPQQALILENADLADTYRKQFLCIWEHAKKPVKRNTKLEEL